MNPFSKVRSAVLMLSTRTMAEPLLGTAEKTEEKPPVMGAGPHRAAFACSHRPVTSSCHQQHSGNPYQGVPCLQALSGPRAHAQIFAEPSALVQGIGTAAPRRVLPAANSMPYPLYPKHCEFQVVLLRKKARRLMVLVIPRVILMKDAFINCKT